MKKRISSVILITIAVLANCFLVKAQIQTIYSASTNNTTIFKTTYDANIAQTNAIAFGGASTGGNCTAAASVLIMDTLSSWAYDSLTKVTPKTTKLVAPNLSFGFKAKAGYKLQIDSITAQVSSPVANLKFRMFYAYNQHLTLVPVDSDFIPTQQSSCNVSTVATQRAAVNFVVPSTTTLKIYLVFFNAQTNAEVDVYNVSVKGCVLPNAANADCNATSNVWYLPPPISNYQLLYNENFIAADSATFYSNNWIHDNYPQSVFGGKMADTNVYVNKNGLNIKYTYQNGYYTGGAIRSTAQFQYGYYETYMRVYKGRSNFHQTFWAFENAHTNTSPDSVPKNNMQIEIDALQVESFYDANYNLVGNEFGYSNHKPRPLYTDALPYNHSGQITRPIGTTTGFDTGWVKVGFEWLPDSVKLYFNDTLRQIAVIPPSWQHHAGVGIEYSGQPCQAGYIPASTSVPPSDSTMQVQYFKYYAPINPPSTMDFIGEGSFDYDTISVRKHQPLCWINALKHDIWGNALVTIYDTTATTVVKTNVYNGFGAVKQYNKTPYKTALRQHVYNLTNTNYLLKAWVNCSGGQDTCQMRVLTGGKLFTQNITNTNGNWVQIALPVAIQNNKAVVEFYSAAKAGNFLYIDEVSMNMIPSILPVNIINLNIKANKKGAIVQWEIAKQIDVANYFVERSFDGVNFSEINTVYATNETTYLVEDNQLFNNTTPIYYRIKALSKDGSSFYSSLAMLKTNYSALTITLFPNPAKEILNISVKDNDSYSIKIFDDVRKQVLKKSRISASNVITLNVNSLSSGNYFIELTGKKGGAYVSQFVKQ